MKSIKTKFKINPCTYLLILVSCFTGFFKNILLILMIVIFHEIGHIIAIRHFEYEIEKVEIYPFGGITKVNKPINTPLKKEIIISVSGVLFQIILYLFFCTLYHQGFILENTFYFFQNYNKIILLFNLIPIIPLDGSILFHSILEYFFPYQKAYRWYLIGTVVTLLAFITLHTIKSLNNYMMLTFLLFKTYDAIKKKRLLQNKFYLERYLYEIPYEKIESHSIPNLTKLKKDTLHFFWKKDRYLHEKEFLKEHYTSSIE